MNNHKTQQKEKHIKENIKSVISCFSSNHQKHHIQTQELKTHQNQLLIQGKWQALHLIKKELKIIKESKIKLETHMGLRDRLTAFFGNNTIEPKITDQEIEDYCQQLLHKDEWEKLKPIQQELATIQEAKDQIARYIHFKNAQKNH